MVSRLIAAMLSALLCIAFALLVGLSMLLAMNGYSESDATWGLAAFAGLVLIISTAVGSAAWFGAGLLIRKTWHAAVAALVSTIVCTMVGAVLVALAGIAGVGLAEVVRVNF
jgi:hypothetical protein